MSRVRVPMREQPVSERVRNFEEVPLGYSADEAVKEANRCLQCKNSPCIDHCPVMVDVKKFVKEKFAPDTMVDIIESVYSKLLSR